MSASFHIWLSQGKLSQTSVTRPQLINIVYPTPRYCSSLRETVWYIWTPFLFCCLSVPCPVDVEPIGTSEHGFTGPLRLWNIEVIAFYVVRGFMSVIIMVIWCMCKQEAYQFATSKAQFDGLRCRWSLSKESLLTVKLLVKEEIILTMFCTYNLKFRSRFFIYSLTIVWKKTLALKCHSFSFV